MKRALLVSAIVLSAAAPADAVVSDCGGASRSPRATATPAASPPRVPSGVYRVTDVYVADVVTRSGDLTTYSTTTQHRITDTYARVLAYVGTGVRSPYDGRAFNGRASLSDGTLVAGTYYQNFVFDGTRFQPVSIVFFQDDSELARRRAATPQPARTPTPTTATRLVPVPTTPAPVAAPRTPAPTLGPITIGVDPSGGPALLDSIEVARGAAYALRVNMRGAATLLAWSFVGGVNDATNTAGWHDATAPLQGQWLRLAPPGETWVLTLRVRVAPSFGGSPVEREGTVRVGVRSPAIVD